MPNPTTARPRISMFLKSNRYGGTCEICATPVEEHRGFIQKDRDSGRWQTLCHACVRTHGRVTPILREDGVPFTASTGAVNQTSGSADVLNCNGCGADVVYIKSTRGKWYLANVSHGRSGHAFYIGANVHKCDHRHDA